MPEIGDNTLTHDYADKKAGIRMAEAIKEKHGRAPWVGDNRSAWSGGGFAETFS